MPNPLPRRAPALTLLIVLLAVTLGACTTAVQPPAAAAPPAAPAAAPAAAPTTGLPPADILLLAPPHAQDAVADWLDANAPNRQVTIVSEVDAGRPPDILITLDNFVAADPFALRNNAIPNYSVTALPVPGHDTAAVAELAGDLAADLAPELGVPQPLPYLFTPYQWVSTTFTPVLGVTVPITTICCPLGPLAACAACAAGIPLVIEVPDASTRTQLVDWLDPQGITAPVVIQLPGENGAFPAHITLTTEDVANLTTVEEFLDDYAP